MPNYRRDHTIGGTWFFTVVTCRRRPILCRDAPRTALRRAILKTRSRHPFRIEAWVLLPNHFHALWTLPSQDGEYALRISLIKRYFTQTMRQAMPEMARSCSASRRKRGEGGFWQRRFWEHRIRDEEEFANHMDYVHYNPVKHGHCLAPEAWPYTSLHRYQKRGVYPRNWGAGPKPEFSLSHHAGEI